MNTAARLPSVDRVLSTPLARALSAEYGASSTTAAVRTALDALRPGAVAAGLGGAAQPVECAALGDRGRGAVAQDLEMLGGGGGIALYDKEHSTWSVSFEYLY